MEPETQSNAPAKASSEVSASFLSRWTAFGVLLGFLIFGLGVAIFWNADREMRNTILSEATLIGASMDAVAIEELEGRALDLERAEFARVRRHLQEVLRVRPEYARLSIVGERADGRVVFLVDVQREVERDRARPGASFGADPGVVASVLSSRRGRVLGPLQEAGEPVVRPLIPIVDANSGEAVGVLVVDLSGATWNAMLVRKMVIPVLIGAFFFLLVIVLKIVNRQRRELSLQTERFEKLADQLPGALYQYVLDPRTGRSFFPYATRKFKEILGVTPSEVKRDSARAVAQIDTSDLSSFLESIRKSAAELTPWRFEFALKDRKADEAGRRSWREGYATPEKLDDGKILWNGFMTDITQRKRDGAELERRERLLRTLFDAIPGFIALKDAEGHFVMANRAYAEGVGFSLDQVVGKTDADIAENVGFPEEFDSEDASILSEGKTRLKAKVAFKSKDGTVYWVNTSRIPFAEPGTGSKFLLILAFDFTQQESLTRELSATKRQLQSFFDTTEDLLCIFNAKGKVERWNAAWQTKLGFSMEVLKKKPQLFDYLHPEDVDAFAGQMGDIAQGKASSAIEVRCVDADGEYRWFEWKLASIEGQIYGHARDITLRKEEESGMMQRDRWQQLLMTVGANYINLPIEEIDEAIRNSLGALGDFTHSSEVFLYDFDAEEGTAKVTHHWLEEGAEGIHASDDSFAGLPFAATPEWSAAHAREEIFLFDLDRDKNIDGPLRRFLAKHGLRKLLSVPMVHRSNCDGFIVFLCRDPRAEFDQNSLNLLSFFAQMLVNVNQRRVTQERLQSVNASLEKQQQLAQSMADRANQANQAKGAFLATMSHEIRTPLNSVIGMTSLLMNTQLNQEQQEFVETIQGSGKSLLALINDILDFSKIESERIELENIAFSPVECVAESIDSVAGELYGKEIHLTQQLNSELPRSMLGDTTRIRQILINLLSNAVKFSDVRSIVHLQLDGSPVDDSGDRWNLRISVCDHGIGISEEGQKTLFQPFIQADSSITRRFGGTGLGLVISRKLARMMGGDITVKSAENEGATFTLEIPLQRASSEKLGAIDPALAKLLEGRKILVVDDFPEDREYLEAMAACWQMRPKAIAHGPDSVAYAKGLSPDIMLISEGYKAGAANKFARSVQETDWGKNIPMIRLQSISSRREKSSSELFLGSSNKPIRPINLASLLVQTLKRSEELVSGDSGKKRVRLRPDHSIDEALSQEAPLNILVVEDNPINQRVIGLILKKMGYVVTFADDGKQGFEAVEQGDYNFVLMDLEMPVMGGMDSTRMIRERIPEEKQPYIAALSANAAGEQGRACIEQGMNAYLSKPVRIPELSETIQKAITWLKERGSTESSPAESPTSSPVEYADATASTQGQSAQVAAVGTIAGDTKADAYAILDEVRFRDFSENGGEGTFVTDMLNIVGQQWQSMLNALSEEGDPERRERALELLNALRGSLASIGLMRLSYLMGRIEDRLAAGDEFPTPEMVADIVETAQTGLDSIRETGLVPADYDWEP